jgi:hypothetical protein
MQMGVEVSVVPQPVTAEQRAGLRLIEKAPPPQGGAQGSGSVFAISHRTNASFKAINEALAAGAKAGFVAEPAGAGPDSGYNAQPGDVILSGIDRDRMNEIARKHSVVAQALAKAPEGLNTTRKPRVGLYRSWVPAIDEGWTRWILENYGFAPATLRNGDVQAGHLSERFDAIIIPDSSPRSILEGYSSGTISGEYAGGLGEVGVDALREFVRRGGTLIAFNNASLMAIDSLGLPVSNTLEGLKNDQFFCSGSLLKVELRDLNQPGLWGMQREPIVMFERGPAFEPKSGFQGTVLAAYPKDRNPLASGFLLHPERIQGKAAALEVFYGGGRVYLFGFKPQWRGQSHGTYKLIFNAIYDSPGLARPTAPPKPAGQKSELASSQPESWRTVTGRVHTDLAALLRQNQAFFAARGQQAVEERAKLSSAADQFEKDRIQEVEDASIELDESSRKKVGEYIRRLRRVAADLKAKEFEGSVNGASLSERYGLVAIEQEISTSSPSSKSR